MTPRRTMSIAQELYEGIELGEYGLTGLITYMRTDSLRLADEATAAAAGLHSRPLRRGILSGQAVCVQDQGQRAGRARSHSSVQRAALLPEEIRKYLTPDQFKLYRLIWSRFVAARWQTPCSTRFPPISSARVRCSAHPVIRSRSRVLLRFLRKARTTRKKQDSAGKAAAALRSGRQADCRENRAVPALYAAAGPLHRGIAHPCDGGTRHRPAVHLCADYFDHHRPRLRHQGEQGAPSDAARRRRYRPAG